VLVTTSATSLTSFAILFGELTFGEQYYWRVTYYDGAEHPSLVSDEATFTFGPPPTATTLINFSDSWKYNFAIQATDASWAATAFDDSTWAGGQGTLAFENQASIPETIRTTLPDPRTLTPAGRVYYFRRHFNCPVNPAQLTNLRIRHMIDDGAVIYINGQARAPLLHECGGDVPVHAALERQSRRRPVSVCRCTHAAAPRRVDVDRPASVPGARRQRDRRASPPGHRHEQRHRDGPRNDGDRARRWRRVVIAEVCANPATGGDWIELRNVTAGALNISGWGLTDDILNPTRYVFPAATSLAAGATLIVYFDNETMLAGLHTGFGLDSGGQRVVLTNGNSIKDYVAFGPQARGYTIGRVPDGAGAFTLCTPTQERGQHRRRFARLDGKSASERMDGATRARRGLVRDLQR
jgi:hypothetical protein